MAKKKKKEKHIHAPRTIKPQRAKRIPVWIIPAILIITFFAYIPTLSAGFVTLDDGDYVTDNYLLKSFSNLNAILSTPVQGNFHPLTMFSLAINYQISGMNAWSYHVFNLLLHLINCVLVFRLAMMLSRNNIIISLTAAILFAIHPMHVESVAWVSERKDVLYSVFFLAGLISYTKFVDSSSKKQYVWTVLFLTLSLLSKPAAVIFPLTLFCIDLLKKRKLNLKLLIEKIPFFILALIFGIITMINQKAVGATGQESFDIVPKILFGFYGIMMYVLKMIAPFSLAVFYPFPPINKPLPVEYYIGPVFFIALAVLFYYGLKKERIIAFGILLYLVNLLLVLQFLPVGSAVIAERYTYIPYIGLFFVVGWLIEKISKANTTRAYSIIFVLAIFFSIFTFKQAGVWKNGATLWEHTIKTQPSSKAYANRALLLRRDNNYPLAIEYYKKAIQLNKIDHEAYGNLGNVYFDLQKPDSAFYNYRYAISLKPDYHPAMDNMGAMFAVVGQYDSAIKYFTRAIEVKPDYKPAYSNRALAYMTINRYEEAIKDYEKFLQYEPDAADIYNSIGSCYQRLGKYQESLISINKAIELIPNPVFFLNRSYTYNGLNNPDQARKDALTAKQNGVQIPDDYAKTLGIQ